MKKILTVLVLAVFLSGCTGSFNLTRKVYNFHRSQSDKWMDELCFLLVALTPIYGLATFADAIVFNSIEFWSGENPIETVSAGTKEKLVKNGNEELLVAFDSTTEQVTLKTAKQPVILERTDEMVLAKNEKGDVLFSSMKTESGDISVYDGEGKLVKSYSADEVASLKAKVLKN